MADRDDPPFDGGSQPVKQMPPSVPSSRPSPMPVIMGVIVFLLIAVGFVFIFSH